MSKRPSLSVDNDTRTHLIPPTVAPWRPVPIVSHDVAVAVATHLRRAVWLEALIQPETAGVTRPPRLSYIVKVEWGDSGLARMSPRLTCVGCGVWNKSRGDLHDSVRSKSNGDLRRRGCRSCAELSPKLYRLRRHSAHESTIPYGRAQLANLEPIWRQSFV